MKIARGRAFALLTAEFLGLKIVPYIKWIFVVCIYIYFGGMMTFKKNTKVIYHLEFNRKGRV